MCKARDMKIDVPGRALLICRDVYKRQILDSATQDRLNPSDSITIQPRVWLCRGVTVLKGCTIGPDTVVGGYSIVTDSLPAGVLAVGSPAKVIRQGITWKRERVASGQPASSNSPD